MPSNYSSLTVTWYDETDSYSTTSNITADVKSLPLFTDTGTGEVNQATIIVRSKDGLYNTSGSVIFAEFDRIRIQCTDLGSNSYDKYFEIINIIPSVSKNEGTLLTLECLGIEYHTQHIHMTKPYYFEDSYTVALSIGDIYSRNRGSKQPTLSNYDVVYSEGNGFGSALPFFNANNWEFGLYEDTCYNRWMDLVDNGGAAVSAGGALTFYEMNFPHTGVNAMNFKLRESGDNSTVITVKNAKVTSPETVGEQEGMISNPTGTNLLAWGSPEHGSLPVDFSKYDSHLMQFIFRPEWGTGIVYAVDAKIKVTPSSGTPAAKHYVCAEAHTSGTFATDLAAGKWTQIDMSTEFGDSLQYSPWTDGKARLWSNAGADPARSNFTSGGWFDMNIVINEDTFFRTWVDGSATTDAELDTLAAEYAYDETRSTFPRGFRVLVRSNSPTGDLSAYPNMVVERIHTNSLGTSTWRKLYNFTTENTKVQVVDLDTASIWADTITAGPSHSWADITGTAYANDCIHPYTTAPAEVDGVDLVGGTTRSEITDSTERPDITLDGSEFSQNQESGIRFISQAPDAITSAATDATGRSDPWYKHGIGINLRFPFPNNVSGISENIGELYGGGSTESDPTWQTSTAYSVGNIVYESQNRYICITAHTSDASTFSNDSANWRQLVAEEPSTLDIQNQNYTHDGQDGFNTINSASEDYGQINAVAFWLRMSIIETAGSTELNDEHRFRAWFIDTKDNVVYQDFAVRFSNNWEDIRLPISGFRIYKGRKPLYGFDAAIAAFKPPKELEIINIFEWRNIKLFGIQYQPQYDEYGRFNPAAATVNESGNSVTWANILGAKYQLDMDGFRFIKPLLTTSGNVTDRNLEPEFQQWPNVTLYHQLLNISKSHLEIEKFKHKEFNLERSGDDIFDIPFGNSFYLENDKVVSDSDNGSNTIQLVNKRTEYSITKTPGGKGGLRSKMKGVKVFT